MKPESKKTGKCLQGSKKGFWKKLWWWIGQNKILLGIFAVYLVVTFVAVLFHENWEDEAQAWITARDCSPFELIGRMRYEGHFLPWYFIIMPFAKLGFPFKTINVISWVISGSSAWLFLKYLPCKKYKRVLLIFTLPMVYLYPVIARCYCLIPLATILLIMFYKQRFQKPIKYLLSIILLANIHIYCFMFAFIVGLEFLIDWLKQAKKMSKMQNHKIMLCIITTVVVTGILYLPLIGSLGGTACVDPPNFGRTKIDGMLFVGIKDEIDKAFMTVTGPVIYILASVIISYMVLYKFNVVFDVFLCFLWQLVIQGFFYGTVLPQRVFILLFVFIFFLVTNSHLIRKKEPGLLLRLLFSILLIVLVITKAKIFDEFLCFTFLIFAFVPYIFNYKKIKYVDIGLCFNKLYLVALIALAFASAMDGISYITNEIKYTYTSSYTTAIFIKNELMNKVDNGKVLIIIDYPVALHYMAIAADMDDPNFKLFSISYDDFITYDPLSLIKYKPNNDEKELRDYCRDNEAEGRCYYLLHDDALKEGREKVAKYDVDGLVEDGSITEIYNSDDADDGWDLAETEHFHIYRINITD